MLFFFFYFVLYMTGEKKIAQQSEADTSGVSCRRGG